MDMGIMVWACSVTALYSTGHYIGASILLVFGMLIIISGRG